MSELRELGKHLGTMWPDTSPLEVGLWIPEIELKLPGSAASAFTSRDISPGPFHVDSSMSLCADPFFIAFE